MLFHYNCKRPSMLQLHWCQNPRKKVDLAPSRFFHFFSISKDCHFVPCVAQSSLLLRNSVSANEIVNAELKLRTILGSNRHSNRNGLTCQRAQNIPIVQPKHPSQQPVDQPPYCLYQVPISERTKRTTHILVGFQLNFYPICLV